MHHERSYEGHGGASSLPLSPEAGWPAHIGNRSPTTGIRSAPAGGLPRISASGWTSSPISCCSRCDSTIRSASLQVFCRQRSTPLLTPPWRCSSSPRAAAWGEAGHRRGPPARGRRERLLTGPRYQWAEERCISASISGSPRPCLLFVWVRGCGGGDREWNRLWNRYGGEVGHSCPRSAVGPYETPSIYAILPHSERSACRMGFRGSPVQIRPSRLG
jgi:hypothetical protein